MKRITLTDIRGSWRDIITRLEKSNSKIAHFLEDVHVHSFDGEQIVIDLINGHRFHLKTLEKDAILVEKEMYDILGQEIKLKFRLDEDGIKRDEPQQQRSTNKMNTILTTTDYDGLKFLKGNRPINKAHLNNLIKSMKQR